MKKNHDLMEETIRQHFVYSGLEPVYSREFIENEENEEYGFFSERTSRKCVNDATFFKSCVTHTAPAAVTFA